MPDFRHLFFFPYGKRIFYEKTPLMLALSGKGFKKHLDFVRKFIIIKNIIRCEEK